MILGITGASGFIGQALTAEALREQRNVILFSRHPKTTPESRSWSDQSLPNIDGCDQLVHLAGESILGLWTKKKRERILMSRREGTRRLIEAIAQSSRKPSLLVSASAIGYYGNNHDSLLDESTCSGNGFLAEVARAWEEEALKAEAYGVRVVLMRIGIVLGRNGTIMKLMIPLFRLGLGGVVGSGKQWMSCIHINDLVRLILQCCDDPSLCGPLNAVMPEPITNATFTKTLGTLLQKPTPCRIPAIALRILLGELSTLLLNSQRVLPQKATRHHYNFKYPTLEKALTEIITG